MIKKLASGILGELAWTNLRYRTGRLSKNAYYDALTEIVMKRVAKRNSVWIDVGCHKGGLLHAMTQHAPDGTFFAFEPIPFLYAELKARFAGARVTVFNVALSDSQGTTKFNFVVSNPGYSGIRRRSYDRVSEVDQEIEVMTDTLDNVLGREKIKGITFIKVDVEGAEYHVLRGAQASIKSFRPVIVFEHGLGGSDCYGKGPYDIYDLLVRECGLRISLLPNYLSNRRPLNRNGFAKQYYKGLNYYFVAHP